MALEDAEPLIIGYRRAAGPGHICDSKFALVKVVVADFDSIIENSVQLAPCAIQPISSYNHEEGHVFVEKLRIW